jgi:hypothetical protein
LAKQQKKSTTSDQEKPEGILAAAKKVSETRAWRVDARIEANKQMNIIDHIMDSVHLEE